MVRNGQPELWDRWSVRLDRRLVGKEDAVVDHAGQDAAEERSDPVDAVVGPVIAGYQSWAEGAGRVDGCAGEGEAAEGVHCDGEADGEAGHFIESAFGVNTGSEEDED